MGTQIVGYGGTGNLTELESLRLQLQREVDAQKSIEERRMNGQFSTPKALADEIVEYGLRLIGKQDIRFLEPAAGSGVFISSFLGKTEKLGISRKNLVGIEKDASFFEISSRLWTEMGAEIHRDDFFNIKPRNSFDLIITNPPYVRHHYLDREYKSFLQDVLHSSVNCPLSGLAGLYCYFLVHASQWLAPGGICGMLIPSEFMDVRYGDAVKDFLLSRVRLLGIHRYNPEECKFDDALVSSCVVWFQNAPSPDNYDVEFTYGASISEPEIHRKMSKGKLHSEKKWTHIPFCKKASAVKGCLGDFFVIKRGIATGNNGFFILTRKQIEDMGMEMRWFRPILPSPRFLQNDEIETDSSGNPVTDKQFFLLDCPLDEEEIRRTAPGIWAYLEAGKEENSGKYLCKSRKKWYFQEQRESAPFLCSYMGRGGRSRAPFRFIFNRSKAIATNSYLMLYPNAYLSGKLAENEFNEEDVWEALKAIGEDDMTIEGRVYGGGLKKIEPRELANVRIRLPV